MIAATCRPPPASTENTPGLAGLRAIRTPGLDWPRRVERTVNVTRPVPNSVGNCASISVGDVLMRGSVTSFAVTHTPPRVRGNGPPLVVAESARLLPVMLMRAPGETWVLRLAVFTTPLAAKEGARPATGVSDTTVKPETVSRYTLLLPSATIPRGRICV